MSLVENIRSLCTAKSTNFAALERALGFGQGTIRKWDGSSPGTDKLEKIADYFEVSLDYLAGREPPAPVNNDAELNDYLNELKTRPEMRMLFQLSKGAAKSDVEKAVKIIETLLDKEG